MYCSKCGKQINDSDKFCPHCGTSQSQAPLLESSEPSTQMATKNEVVRLVKRAMSGDDSVWGEIYEKTHRYVYFMALKFLRSDQDAQDITQEVYIQTIRSVGQLHSADSFFGWLRTIVYSKCKDFVKKKKPVLLEEEDQDWLANLPEIDDKFLPDITLDSAEGRRMILELVDALPYQQRQTVLFYYYDEMTIEQIASLMECPAGTVKSRLNYARQQIKNGVEEHERKGIKLYGVATLPILTMLLRDQANALPIPPALDGGMGSIIKTTGSPSGASTPPAQPGASTPPSVPGADIGRAVGNTATTAGASTVTLSAKIIVCAVAAVLLIGGGLFIGLGGGNGDIEIPSPVAAPEVVAEIPTPEPKPEVVAENPTPEPSPEIAEEPESEPEEPDVSLDWQAVYLGTIQAAIVYAVQGDWTNHDFFESAFPVSLEGFMLADLNFDGVPELFIFGDSVSAGRSVRIFSITPNGAEVIFRGDSSDIVIPQFHSAIQLYRRTSDGSLAYVLHGGNAGSDSSWGSFFLTNATTRMDSSFSEQARIVEYTWEMEFTPDRVHSGSVYTFNGRMVSEDEFSRLLNELLSGYEMISHEIASFAPWDTIWNLDWSGVNENDLRGFLASFVPER